MPLDQAYVFDVPNRAMAPSGPAALLANERATESCLTLPLAAACSRLFADAASQSQQLASAAAEKTRRKGIVHLPSDDVHKSNAMVEAALSEGCADVELGVVALVLLGESSTQIDMGFGMCGIGEGGSVPSVRAALSFQPPHTIFEVSLGGGSCPLLDEEMGGRYVKGPSGTTEAISMRFCPRLPTGLDDLLPGVAGSRPDGRYVGSIRLEVQVGYANSAVDTISTGISGGTSVEGLVELEKYLDHPQQGGGAGGKVPVLAPAIDANTGRRIGTFILLLRVASNGGRSPLNRSSSLVSPSSEDKDVPPSASGLVSVVGLDTLTEGIGLAPYLDCEAPPPNSQLVASPPTPNGMRRRQVATMGSFATLRFLRHQADVVRTRDAAALSERYDSYRQSIMSGISNEVEMEDESDVPLFKRRTPRPFRPSNSRGDALLAGIGFNVHVQSLSLNVLQQDGGGAPMIHQAAAMQSITHGAPADHAMGFGVRADEDSGALGPLVVGGDSKDSAPRGGLRRLESTRIEFSKELDDSITGLISAVGEHFKSRAQAAAVRQQAGVKTSRHIPPNIPAVTHYRTKAVECAQRLGTLTWDIAVRRANCFSQALGIAVTSYLASLSDGGPAWRGYASIWVRHGYLITFEGLLSSVGKELGMIEDASVAISMLRMVSVVLVPDDANTMAHSANNDTADRIPVPHSPYVRWVNLMHLASSQGPHSKSQYRLEIGVDHSYYKSRVPESLKNGATVQFFPVLFQMGVDIRQWGVNAGRSVTSQIKDKSKGSGAGMADFGDGDALDGGDNEPTGGSILDDGDEDDESGVADNEILMALNVEGCRKLNAYAHATNPTSPGVTSALAPAPVFDSLEQDPQQVVQQLPIHPCLVSLSEAIRASAGKMEHSVLDRAATACQRLGGGSTVFCKSGKDRTAMQVTFKQAQFLQRFVGRKEGGTALEDTPISYEAVFSKATLMRMYGNRIPICEKNAGEPKFAFNPLQRKFMPEMLRPEASLCTWSKPET